jgi:hypothetical protein
MCIICQIKIEKRGKLDLAAAREYWITCLF